MTFQRRLRALAALALAGLLTIVLGLSCLFASLVYRCLFDWWAKRFWMNPFELTPKWWSHAGHELANRKILRMETLIDAAFEPPKPGETIVVMANHPTNIGTPSFVWFVTKYLGSRLSLVAKSELKWNPFIGWPLWAIKSGMFTDRTNNERAIAALREGMRETAGRVIIIFLDGTRPTAISKRDSRKKFRKHVGQIPQHTTAPKSGGLEAILLAAPENTRWFDITFWLDKSDNGVQDTPRTVGSNIHIDVEEVERPPSDRTELDTWVNGRYERKNKMIEASRRSCLSADRSTPALRIL